MMARATSYLGATVPALVVLAFFVGFANWIPQTRWEAPKARQISAAMSPGALADIGRLIVRERGCLACHTVEPGGGVKGQGRGPNLANIAARRWSGVPGGPDDLVGYLAQALYEPGAYLVEGYSNIMPPSIRPPAKLTYEEVVAVVAYLQSLGGSPSVTVGGVPRWAADADSGAAVARAAQGGEAAATDPAAMLTAYNCLDCHSLEPGEVLLGPPLGPEILTEVAAERGLSPEAFVMESIVRPGAFERGEFPKETMPDDYGERLTAAQLEAMVAHLLGREARE